jgi:hypothetical protein
VTLARVARERRHIRNNLPLRGVLVIAANKEDVEALDYLKGASGSHTCLSYFVFYLSD